MIGVLIGYTQPSTNGGLQGETEAAIPGSHNPNLTSGEQDTYSLTQSECRSEYCACEYVYTYKSNGS